MELEKSPLYDDVKVVLNSSAKPVHFQYRGEIIANGVSYKVLQILNLDVMQDYELNYGDEVVISVVLPLGTFVKGIYPFRNNLEFNLYKEPLDEGTDTYDMTKDTLTEKFTAYLLNGTDPIIQANGSNILSIDEMNLLDLPTVQLQLVSKSLEQLRLINIGGTYRNCIPGDVLKAVLTTESKKIKVPSNLSVVGVSMVEPDNTGKRDHVQLPHGLSLVDMPQYIQSRCGGVYNSGIGYYFKDNIWYVYPAYNTVRYEKEVRTMTIINIPENKLPGIERTYELKGNNLLVLATGESKFTDRSDLLQMSDGNGVMYADGTKYMGKFATVQNNKATTDRKGNVSEYTSEKRENKLNSIQLSTSQITANPFSEHSKLARRQGSLFSFVWQNSNPNLIFPGMMIKIMYLDGETTKEFYGTLLKAHHYTQAKGTGVTNRRHSTNTAFSVFVKAIQNEEQQA